MTAPAGNPFKGAKFSPVIDPFRQRQVPEVAGRFLREQKRHQRQAALMWLGAMTAMFSDHDLQLLQDLGYLSQHDRDLLGQAGRPVQVPAPARRKRTAR